MNKSLFAAIAVVFLFLGCSKNNTQPVTPNKTIPGTFTIPAESISLNPTGNAPLSAPVHFKSPVSGHTGRKAPAFFIQIVRLNQAGLTHNGAVGWSG